ncbi:hypothetical protein [Comamonas terrigena]|uniref:hypothetical protein n=1 Tax=Comamonas terrigena TaxID=32013 RepID=UPI00244BEEB3|nr:hypothetical protein [Comamonas terrigena]MDH0049253.1 hypothetical protein [Comamonas terrigena]MDH0511958.1 hypothetical protein [Comamonas terrigena]MDH1091664.1 hypothetical protein [Comamonas terrigena]
MKSTLLPVAAAATIALLAGCSTTSGGTQYKASTQNVIRIQEQANGAKVRLVDFTAAAGVSESPWCRANGPISIGSGKSPAQFIHDALQEELFLAQVYSPSASTTISGRLDAMSFSSVSPANWEISLTLSSSTGASYQTKNHYEYETSWAALSACKNVADAFAPAVTDTLKKAISDARFKTLLTK